MNDPKLKKACLAFAKAECANNYDGNCCPQDTQCFAFSLGCGFCTWFLNAVLPLNPVLQSAVMEKMGETPSAGKLCAVCGKPYIPGSNRQRYCPECAKEAARVKHAKRSREYRERNGA